MVEGGGFGDNYADVLSMKNFFLSLESKLQAVLDTHKVFLIKKKQSVTRYQKSKKIFSLEILK